MVPKYAEITIALVVFLFLFFALFLLLGGKGKRLSKNLLGFFFLSMGLSVLDVYLVISGLYTQYPQYAFLLNALPLLYGPLLWLLTLSVTHSIERLRTKDYLHFLPFLLAFLSMVFTYHLRDLSFKQEFLRRSQDVSQMETLGSSAIAFLIIGLYLFFSFRHLRSYRRELQEQVSNTDQLNLEWLQHTLSGFGLIIGFSLITQLINSLGWELEWVNSLLLILLFGMLIFIMSTIVKGLRSESIFVSELTPLAEQDESTKADEAEVERLKAHMETSQTYLNSSITLKELATELDLAPRALSNLINRGTGQSFFDFINSHRIRYAQQKMTESTDEKLTILEVMYAAGFNSKSSFNTAFKKHSGLTPTQWKKQRLP